MGFFQKKNQGRRWWRRRRGEEEPPFKRPGQLTSSQLSVQVGEPSAASRELRGILAEICTANTQYLWLLPGKDSGPTWSKHISAARRQTATSQSTEAGTVCGAEHQVSNDGPTLLSSSVFISLTSMISSKHRQRQDCQTTSTGHI